MMSAFKSAQKAAAAVKSGKRRKVSTAGPESLAAASNESHDPVSDKKTKGSASGSQGQQRALIPFEPHHRVLFVGEGDFSFAASCFENHLDAEGAAGSVATSFDSAEEVVDKYGTAVESNLERIQDAGGSVLHKVDATKLSIQLPGLLVAAASAGDGGSSSTHDRGEPHDRRQTRFDRIVFLFPHVASGIADQDRNVLANQRMLQSFFGECRRLLLPQRTKQPRRNRGDGSAPKATNRPPIGRVCVTLATGPAYELWDIRGLAKTAGLANDRSGAFDGSVFPGYAHQRTEGDRSGTRRAFSGGQGEERAAKWYIFKLPDRTNGQTKQDTTREDQMRQQQKRRRARSDDASDSDD